MPIIDYLCAACHHVDSHYVKVRYAASKRAEHSRCSKCHSKSDRDYMVTSISPGPSIGFTSKSQKSSVVHFNPKTNQYSVPGHRDDPVDRGYKKVEITSMRQYEKVRRDIEAVEKEKADFLRAANDQYFDDVSKEHRRDRKAEIESAIAKGGHWVQSTDDKGITRTRWAPISPRARQLFDLACQRQDRRREEIRRSRQSSPNFHSRLLEHRESERSIVSGEAKRPEPVDIKSLLKKVIIQRNGR